jgi:hypothetical protein
MKHVIDLVNVVPAVLDDADMVANASIATDFLKELAAESGAHRLALFDVPTRQERTRRAADERAPIDDDRGAGERDHYMLAS